MTMKSILAVAALLFTTGAWCAETVDDLLRKGDAYDQKMQASEALKYYLPAEKADGDNARILTRIARQYRHLMADAKAKDEKLRLGKLSLIYGLRAAELAPNDCEAQLSPAISYGKMLPLLGSKEQVDASPKIKNSVDKALALDSRNDSAWHILGRWNRVLADIGPVKRTLAGALYGKLPAGSLPEAERCLKKAIAINPDRPMHHIELGRIYAQMGRKEDARRLINKGLAMPSVEKDDVETKALGREALEKLR
jgi:tetratricopeptide (TPR) repeat protein